jgi:parvulin-like peptidyl-prolyl isomerase
MGVDEMDMDFADAAYKLEIGEISKPVKTNYGYSIIKVEDRLGNPFLTETEFLKQKSTILDSYYEYAKNRAVKDHAAKLQNEVEINQEIFNQLYNEFKPGFSENGSIESFAGNSAVDDAAILLKSELATWDVKTFRQKAKYTSEGQRNWIRNKENFKEYIIGLLAREQVVRKARDKGYDSLNEYRVSVDKKFKDYQIDRLKRDILASIETPADSINHFYQTNKNAFFLAGKANLREIILDNPETVKKVKKLISSGKPFEDVAREYSINRNTAVYGGEMGFLNYFEFGPYAEEIKKLKPGQWTGPLKKGKVSFFLQCIEQEQPRLKTFDEAKPEVIAKYKSTHFDLAMQDKINEIKSRTQVLAYPDRLRHLKYN